MKNGELTENSTNVAKKNVFFKTTSRKAIKFGDIVVHNLYFTYVKVFSWH